MDLRAGAAALALATLLLGCAPLEHRAPPPARAATPNLSGFSPDFKAGYADGCTSATGPMKRDPARYEADGGYARGWRDGYSGCRK